ncbi:MAG: hypothetical protein WCH21_07840 [Bacteroidota bacterium]
MIKATPVYLQYLLCLVISLNALKVASQNEIVFSSGSVSSKNPHFLFSLTDKVNDFLEAKNSPLLKFNKNEVINYKTVEAHGQYSFKSSATKKHYFDFQKEKYYYYNNPTINRIFLKKI